MVIGLVSRVDRTIEEEKRLHDEKVKRDGARKRKIRKGRAHDEVQHTHQEKAKKEEGKVDFNAARERLRAQARERKVACLRLTTCHF